MINSQVWSQPAEQILRELQTTIQGLTSAEASRRLGSFGANLATPHKTFGSATLLAHQFKSPIILILIFAAVLSLFLHDRTDALIILAIVVVSGLLGFWQERGATDAVEKLLAMVQIRVSARRNNETAEIPLEEIVPGDVVELSAGSGVTGDFVILE